MEVLFIFFRFIVFLGWYEVPYSEALGVSLATHGHMEPEASVHIFSSYVEGNFLVEGFRTLCFCWIMLDHLKPTTGGALTMLSAS